MKGGRGTNIPDDDHVMRYVPWGRLRRDEHDNVVGFLPQAFRLRPGEDYLSVNWQEYYEGDRDTQIRLSVWAMRSSFGAGRKSAFAVGNVGRIKEVAQTAGARIRITHEPDGEVKPGHAGLRRLPSEDLTLLEALAADAFTDRVDNAQVIEKPPAGQK